MKAYQIKIKLIDSEPLIWRRVIVPAEITFKRLHDTIQFAMGWWDSHLYEFEFPEEKLRITCDDESFDEWKYYSAKYKTVKPTKKEDPLGIIGRMLESKLKKSQSTKIDKYLAKYTTFEYVYDFGDHWQHKIQIERVIDDYPFGYPQVLEGDGACPPEDVGGIGGYEEFLKAWNDPKHPEHDSVREWGEGMNDQPFDIVNTNELMKECLKLKKV